MKVLLTGATGFLGAHIGTGLLERGYNVYALHRKGSSFDEWETILKIHAQKKKLLTTINWVECDILDTEALNLAMQGVDQVYHAAATVSFWKKRHAEMMHNNVQGTANVVNCALAAGVKKLCYASSIAAIGREKTGEIISEKTPWKNSRYNTQYAISKYLAEMEVWRGIEEGLPAVMVNPGVILGEGKWDKGSCRIINTAYKGLKFYTKGKNGYVDVQDVARAMIQLMESDITAERYIMVSENVSFKELLTKITAEFGKPAPSIPVSGALMQAAKLYYYIKSLLSGKEPLVSTETGRNGQKEFLYSSEKIKTELDFSFTPLDETIKRTCRAYLESIK